MSKYAVLSDIHGNLYALRAVMADMECLDTDGILLLGDLIDYGMQSNETVAFIRDEVMPRFNVVCNIRGNHEDAVLSRDYRRFSSERGRQCAAYTASILSGETMAFLKGQLSQAGQSEFMLGEKQALAVHASLEDEYWKAIGPMELNGVYSAYDYVFSGHSHRPHFFEYYYDDPASGYRGRHKVIFINPGSVGQPRDHDPRACYAILDTDSGNVQIRRAEYDVDAAMSMYHGQVDRFYRDRLRLGV